MLTSQPEIGICPVQHEVNILNSGIEQGDEGSDSRGEEIPVMSGRGRITGALESSER